MEKEERHRIDDNLLISFLRKDLDKKEEIHVKNWINESKENQNYYNQIESIWSNSEAIADFDAINTKSGLKSVLNKIDSNKIKSIDSKIRRNKLILRIAATFLVLLGIGTIFYQTRFKTNYASISTNGNQTQLVSLSDGSTIKLNSNSKLYYPDKFKRRSREVTLEGEAFFEIESKPKQPFRISVNNTVVEVLGTSFNINAQQNKVIVDVVTGKVAVFDSKFNKDKTLLKKGERAVHVGNEIKKSKNENLNFLAWDTGILEFKNSKLEAVISEIEKLYRNKFILTDSLINDLIITITIDNQTIENVLEEFEILFALEYTLENDTIWLSNNN